jgi:hypothetical protein
MSDPDGFEPTPGAPPAVYVEENIDEHICGHCFEVRYPRCAEESGEVEWCACDRRSQDRSAPTWGDLRSRRRLCWCCAAAKADGGSKWTLHVCRRCSKTIQATNRSVGAVAAPIGVHSLMHGVGAQGGGEPIAPEVAEALAIEFNELFAGVHRAALHGRFRTAELARHFGLFGQTVIPMDDYLAATSQLDDPVNEGLISLITFIRDPLVWVEQPRTHSVTPRAD